MSAKPRITAAVVGTALAGTLVAYVATLPDPEPQRLCEDLQSAVADDPSLAPLVRFANPSCNVPVDCWKIGDDICRYGRRYGPGVGGVNPDGSPATCTPDPQVDIPWPCTGPDASWPEVVDRLRQENVPAKILEMLDERVKARPEPEIPQ